MNGLIAAVLSLPAWALALIAIFGGSTLIWCVIAAGAEHEDGDLIPLNDAAEQRLSEWFTRAAARICSPCNGYDGTCICKAKCPNALCAAEDTTTFAAISTAPAETAWRPEDLDYLNGTTREMPR